MRYYKPNKKLKIFTAIIWLLLGVNIGMFLLYIYQGKWIAFVHYIAGAILSYPLHDYYYRHIPLMEKLSKETQELENELRRLQCLTTNPYSTEQFQ